MTTDLLACDTYAMGAGGFDWILHWPHSIPDQPRHLWTSQAEVRPGLLWHQYDYFNLSLLLLSFSSTPCLLPSHSLSFIASFCSLPTTERQRDDIFRSSFTGCIQWTLWTCGWTTSDLRGWCVRGEERDEDEKGGWKGWRKGEYILYI